MTLLNLQRGEKDNLQSLPLAPGTIYITTDTNEMFLDTNTERIKITNSDGLFLNQTSTTSLDSGLMVLDKGIFNADKLG